MNENPVHFQPERVKPGERPTARKYNQLVDAVDELTRTSDPARQPIPAPVGCMVQQFKVYQVKKDYITCHAYNGTTEDSAGIYRVAKPQQLRGSLTTHNGVAFTAYGTDGQTRTAGGDESQLVIPKYIAGDIIFAIRGVAGGIQVAAAGGESVLQPNGEFKELAAGAVLNLEWLDLNVDARFWAKLHGTPETCP